MASVGMLLKSLVKAGVYTRRPSSAQVRGKHSEPRYFSLDAGGVWARRWGGLFSPRELQAPPGPPLPGPALVSTHPPRASTRAPLHLGLLNPPFARPPLVDPPRIPLNHGTIAHLSSPLAPER